MAHHKRKKARIRTSSKSYYKWEWKLRKGLTKEQHEYSWLCSWPAHWDIIYHVRPKRRHEARLLSSIIRGEADPDDVAWPLGNHKPHNYYW